MSDWVEWGGGKCPLPDHIWCDVLMLDSEIFSDFAGEFNWSDLGDWGGNIIAYRVPVLADERVNKVAMEQTND